MNEIGFCGDNCYSCPRYVATIENDIEKLKEASLMWKRVGWRDSILSADEIKCGGCKTVTWCRYNEIRECARNKSLNNCGECNQYPCQDLILVFEKTSLYARECKALFSEKDFHALSEAFFTKKENLDLIHKNRNIPT